MNALCGQSEKFLSVKAGGKHNDHRALKRQTDFHCSRLSNNIHVLVPKWLSNANDINNAYLCIKELSDRVTQLYPQALGSLFVTFYDSQDYCRRILSRFHAGCCHYLLS
jgi:hypothetical protein